MVQPRVQEVTERIKKRSAPYRTAYLDNMERLSETGIVREKLACGNLAHGMAACSAQDKDVIRMMDAANIAIVTAYNDMLSAHQPFSEYPAIIKRALSELGCTAQVAGGVPAMCDGVTQGQLGMELSLLSRDQIALSTAIALSHNMFDGALCLGVCDKIVPGLLIGALRFGYLPFIFIPAGPMESGIGNDEKARIRKLYSEGKIGRDGLLAMEMQAYHSPGTCTFYGTANSNQMLMEVMGLQLPGSAFVNPSMPLRTALTRAAAEQISRITRVKKNYTPISQVISEESLVNGMVGLLATGGSTNLTIHLVAIARAAGIIINWDDFNDLSAVTPLLAKVYPNGSADVNQFHAAGGMSLLIRELIDNGFLHHDVKTVYGQSLADYTLEPVLTKDEQQVEWRAGPVESLEPSILKSVAEPFEQEGGLKCLSGNLGRAIIKVSAVPLPLRVVEAPARVFNSQDDVVKACKNNEITSSCVIVVRYQGPRANGMPELHQLTPFLSVLIDRGLDIALVTDGRMSGASGKVPAAIHLTPEAVDGGLISKIENGDIIRLDAIQSTLSINQTKSVLSQRTVEKVSVDAAIGLGRELFSLMRQASSGAEEGASAILNKIED